MSILPTGAAGNGTTDDTAAIQTALNTLTLRGGTVQLEDNKVYYVAGNLTIPRGVTLRGCTSNSGMRGNNLSGGMANWNTAAGLKLNPASRITMKGGSALDGVVVRNSALTFPTADDTSFSGNAIFIENEDDVLIMNSAILGFDTAVLSSGAQRGRLERVNIDCVNGVAVYSAFDIWYLREVHCWPFTNVAGGNIRRRGVAFRFANGGDWNKMTDCFAYGYARGAYLTHVNSMTLIGCGFDNVSAEPNRDTIGILLDGNCHDTRLIGCQTAASRRGIVLNLEGGDTFIEGWAGWALSAIGLEIVTPRRVSLMGSIIRDTPQRIYTAPGTTLNQVNVY